MANEASGIQFHHMSAYVAWPTRVALSRVTCIRVRCTGDEETKNAHKDIGCRMRLYGYCEGIEGLSVLAYTKRHTTAQIPVRCALNIQKMYKIRAAASTARATRLR